MLIYLLMNHDSILRLKFTVKSNCILLKSKRRKRKKNVLTSYLNRHSKGVFVCLFYFVLYNRIEDDYY